MVEEMLFKKIKQKVLRWHTKYHGTDKNGSIKITINIIVSATLHVYEFEGDDLLKAKSNMSWTILEALHVKTEHVIEDFRLFLQALYLIPRKYSAGFGVHIVS